MKTFLIQTINGEIKHDFSFSLIQSIEYNNWLYPNSYSYILTDHTDWDISDMIPIGSVEFVLSFINNYRPINVPSGLFDYAGRKILNGDENDISTLSFVKSNDKIKSYTEITDNAPKGNYQISEIIDIESEYRCFVFRNKLVGINYYTGDFKIFPDISVIETMISVYNYSFPYTLDVGIADGKTFVLEIHDFFSCGLYGFSDHRLLPIMFIDSFNHILNTTKNNC